MKTPATILAVASLVATTFAGCAMPDTGHYNYTAQQAEQDRDFVEHIAQLDRADEREELMNHAKAQEMATRHAPASIHTSNTTFFAPSFQP
ncbi:MAG: hypothetical protein QM796_20430 [Chthoniobacteraceae bacterium]